MHKSQGSVYAYAAEIDAWRRRRERPGCSAELPDSRRGSGNAPSAPDRSIAVLPFSYLGPDSKSAYIADGFTAEIISGLSRILALRVISWTSSMTLKESSKGITDIARILGVGRIVEGTVRQEGSRIRVSAHLVNARTDEYVWSQSYEGAIDNLFSIQEQIAQEVAESLELSAVTRKTERLTDKPADFVAWQCLVQARQASLRWRKDSIDLAVRLLREGLSVAGEDARLYAALGRASLQYREAGIDFSEERINEAEACAAKAFALAPDLPAGHQLKGWIHYAQTNIPAAVASLFVALESAPRDPDTLSLLVNCALISGRPNQARPLITSLSAIDPLTPLTRCLPGWADQLEGQFESAVGPYRDMFALDPDNPMARMFLVYVLAAAKHREEAEHVASELPEGMQHSPPGRIIDLMRRALAGEDTDIISGPAAEALESGTDVFPRFAAQAYAVAGNASEAVRWLTVAVNKGFINYPYLSQHDPFLRQISGDERLERLLWQVEKQWSSFPM
jgi:TolB-like protein